MSRHLITWVHRCSHIQPIRGNFAQDKLRLCSNDRALILQMQGVWFSWKVWKVNLKILIIVVHPFHLSLSLKIGDGFARCKQKNELVLLLFFVTSIWKCNISHRKVQGSTILCHVYIGVIIMCHWCHRPLLHSKLWWELYTLSWIPSKEAQVPCGGAPTTLNVLDPV